MFSACNTLSNTLEIIDSVCGFQTKGYTPLHHAAQRGHTEAIALLLPLIPNWNPVGQVMITIPPRFVTLNLAAGQPLHSTPLRSLQRSPRSHKGAVAGGRSALLPQQRFTLLCLQIPNALDRARGVTPVNPLAQVALCELSGVCCSKQLYGQ